MKKIVLSLSSPGLFSTGFTHPMILGPDIPFAAKPVKEGKETKYALYIPGSSVKGALRSAASRIASPFGFTTCGESLSNFMQKCDICELFGKPGVVYPKLFFGDFVPENPVKTYTLTRVEVEDQSFTAAEHALFSVETVAPRSIFTGEILFNHLTDKELELLLLAIAELRLDRLGRMSTVDARVVEFVGFIPPPSLAELARELGEWLWV